jgi:hypothetical protein
MFTIFSCSENVTYEEYVARELAKGIRHDSLIHRIHFGMTAEEFMIYCAEMNRKKIFMPNTSGSAVSLELLEGFNAPVQFIFFPAFEGDGPIKKIMASIKYRDFSYYGEKYAIENLVIEAKRNFEKGYGGNKFFTIPHENKLLKYKYVKIDGNRKIVLNPTFDGQSLEVEFEDLNPESYKQESN